MPKRGLELAVVVDEEVPSFLADDAV